MRAAEIAQALGSARRSGQWWRTICPVHGSRTGRSPTLALRDGDRGLIVHCHAGCARADVLGELRRRGLLSDDNGYRSRPSFSSASQHRTADRNLEAARRIWQAARSAPGTPLTAYLRARDICIDPPHTLRWHGSLRRPDGTSWPAIVARVDHVERGFVGISRTYLSRDENGTWRRLDRAFLGPIAGGAVRLGDLLPDRPLVIAEGIESALAATELSGGFAAWAALSAGGIEQLVLPPEARDIIIAVDHDGDGRGERAARAAASRWVGESRRVTLVIPDRDGLDANDLLRESRRGTY